MKKKTANAKVKQKGKGAPVEQLKIKGTGRIDANPLIESAAHTFQSKVAACDQAEVAKDDAQKALTKSLVDAKLTEYVYEGKDGIMYCAYVPKKSEPKATVRKIKRKKPDLGDGVH